MDRDIKAVADQAAPTAGEWIALIRDGVQHRVREVTDTHVLLVCTTPPTGVRLLPGEPETGGTPLASAVFNTTVPARCERCARLPHPGPIELPRPGEVRRNDVLVVVCGDTWDGRWPTSAGDLCWTPVVASSRRLSTWDVCDWEVVGMVDAVAEAASKKGPL